MSFPANDNDFIQTPLAPPRRLIPTRTVSTNTTNLGNVATHDSLGGIAQERTPILPQIQQSWGQIFREFNRGITDGINLLSSNGTSPHLITQLQGQCNCLREKLEEIAQEHLQRTKENQEEQMIGSLILSSGSGLQLKNLIASLGNAISTLTCGSTRAWASSALSSAQQQLGRILQDLAQYSRRGAEEAKVIAGQIGATVQQINTEHNGPSHEDATDNGFGEFEHFELEEHVTSSPTNPTTPNNDEINEPDEDFNCLFEDDYWYEEYWGEEPIEHEIVEQVVEQNVSHVVDATSRIDVDIDTISEQTGRREEEEIETTKKNEELRLAAIRLADETRNVRTIISRPLGSA